jgi:hypothetical protein
VQVQQFSLRGANVAVAQHSTRVILGWKKVQFKRRQQLDQ